MVVIDVVVYCNGSWAASAEALTPADALYAARKLWDEAYTGLQGCKRFVVFSVNGDVVSAVSVRP